METWLARGGQPERRGWVVKLRMQKESSLLARVNPQANSIHIPVANNCAPTDDQAIRWLQICKANHRKNRIFIHCGVGEGRTSVFCAVLRIAQGVPFDRVHLEERNFGFKPGSDHRAQARYLACFDQRVRSKELHIPNLSRR